MLGSLSNEGAPGLADISITHPVGNGGTIEVYLRQNLSSASTNVLFNTGLPSLPFQVNAMGKVAVGVSVYYELAFHYNTAGNVSFDTTAKLNHFDSNRPANEMAVTIDATLPSDFDATIGFLHGSIKNIGGGTLQNPAARTEFVGTFGLNNLDNVPTVTLGGRADVNLQLSGGFGSGDKFPSIDADFHLHWQFVAGDPLADAPLVSFDNVKLDLGEFLTGILKPIVSAIQTATAPLQAPLDVLNTPIPGLSQLTNLLGQGDATLLSIAKTVAGKSEYGWLVNLVSTVATLVGDFANFQLANGTILIPLGGFDLDQYDLRTETSDPNDPNRPPPSPAARDLNNLSNTSLTNLLPEHAHDVIIGPFVDSLPAPARDIMTKLTQPNGINFQFPILDHPATAVFGLLLGEDSDLASFTADFHFASAPDFGSSVSLFGVSIGFGGSVSVDAHFKFAYDTFGLREMLRDISSGGGNLASDALDGFYIDTSSHLSIGASVGIKAAATALVFSAAVDGAVATGDASGSGVDHPAVVSFVDPNGNGYGRGTGSGKLRFADFNTSRITTAGELDASLTVEVRVGVSILGTFIGYSVSDDIARVKLLDLNSGAQPSPPPEPVLASIDNTGVVTLDVGLLDASKRYLPDATAEHKRLAGTNEPSGESYTISHISGDDVSGETILVSAFGQSQIISGVKRITCNDDDQGDLTINVQSGVTSDVRLAGGLGHADFTYSGKGFASLHGGKLSSTLRGGYGANALVGGPGDDTIVGTLSTQNDIHGGTGSNTIVVTAPQLVLINGGSNDPNAYTTLVLVEPQGDEVTSLAADIDGSVLVTVQKPDQSDQVSLDARNVSHLILDPGHGRNTVTVGDLSETSLQILDLDVTDPDVFGGNHVTITGSQGQDSFSGQQYTDAVSGESAYVTQVDHKFASGPGAGLTIEIAGLVSGDTLTLDGGGGSNSITMLVSPDTPFVIGVQDTGPVADDSVELFGFEIPSGELDISDSAVTFNYLVQGIGFIFPALQQITFDQNVRELTVHASLGDEIITANRSFGTTAIDGGFGHDDFEVSGASQYTLVGHGVSDAYYVSWDPFSQGITVLGNVSGTSETLVVDDSTFQSARGTEYSLSSSSITRVGHLQLPGNLRIDITSSVNVASLTSVTLDAGPGLLAQTDIDVESTGAGRDTTINSGDGSTNVAIAPKGQSLNNVAGSLSINGSANGSTSVTVDDQATPSYLSSYVLSNRSVNLSSVEFDPMTQVPAVFYCQILYKNVSGLTLETDAALTANNSVRVLSTVGAQTVLITGASRSEVTVSDEKTQLDAIGNLNIIGGRGTDLILDDRGTSNTKDQESFTGASGKGGTWEITTSLAQPTYLVKESRIERTNRTTFTDDLEDAYDGNIIAQLGPPKVSSYTSSIGYLNIASLLIKGGDSDNSVSVLGTARGTQTTIDAGIGKYVINVGDANTNLDDIGTLAINGNAGTNLTLDDEANSNRTHVNSYDDGSDKKARLEIQTYQSSPNYRITGQNVARTNQIAFTDVVYDPSTLVTTPLPGSPSTSSLIASISFPGVASVQIKGGATQNVFNVQGATAATPITISTGPGDDAVEVGNPDDGLIEGIELLTVHGNTGTTLILDDQGNAPVTLKGARAARESSAIRIPARPAQVIWSPTTALRASIG